MINGQTARFLFIKNRLKHPYQLLEDNQILHIAGLKIRCISSPGHTPGAMCYLVNDTSLFVGDSMSLRNGKADLFNEFFNMDSETQKKSIRKLAKLEKPGGVAYVITAHYGYTDNFQHTFNDWK